MKVWWIKTFIFFKEKKFIFTNLQVLLLVQGLLYSAIRLGIKCKLPFLLRNHRYFRNGFLMYFLEWSYSLFHQMILIRKLEVSGSYAVHKPQGASSHRACFCDREKEFLL